MLLKSTDINGIKSQLDSAALLLVYHFETVTHELRSVIQSLSDEVLKLREQNEELRRMLFGSRSEKMPSPISEIRRQVVEQELFPSPEQETEGTGQKNSPTDDEAKARKRKIRRKSSEPKRKERRTLRKNLPVIREQVVVPLDKLPEGYGPEDFREVTMGDGGDSANVVCRIDHVREHLVVVEYHLQTLASNDKEVIITAEAPPAVVEGGHYGPGVYAHVIENKCLNSLPLYRISKMLERSGCFIARSTLCDMYHRGAIILRPIYNRLLELTRLQTHLNADETKLRYLSEGKCKTGWIWTLVSRIAIVYMFSLTRDSKSAQKLLGETFGGKLQIDGYAAYNAVCDDEKNNKGSGRERVGCWSHCRRGFFKSLKNYPEAKGMLDLILDLYKVEYLAAEKGILGTDEHLAMRQEQSTVILEKIKRWLDAKKILYPPKSEMGKAIIYARNQWTTLIAFKDDPLLCLDNNLAENALRIIALGRKNFLFTANEFCGQNLAILQTIVATCLLHGVKPYAYIRDVIIRIQDHPFDRIDELLPQNWAQHLSQSS